ncbi:MAG: hypothetical protein U1F87_14485 [Kiritimatiellia bacterium]
MHPLVELEETRFDVAPGDRYVLCSDGFSNMVGPQQMLAVFANGADLSMEDLAVRLVQAANAQGGMDNISVVIVEVVPSPVFDEPRGEIAEPAGGEDAVDRNAETLEMPRVSAPPEPRASAAAAGRTRLLRLVLVALLAAAAGWFVVHH